MTLSVLQLIRFMIPPETVTSHVGSEVDDVGMSRVGAQ